MQFIISMLEGIVLGAGAILPGISSGVFCVVFGIYEKLVNSILNFFKDIKNNFKFLLPIALGILIGAILFGNILKYFFNIFPLQTKFCFIGLILGCIPALLKTVNSKANFKLHYLLYSICTFLLAFILFLLEKHFVLQASYININYFYLVISGFFMSIGVVVPGVSSSAILMLLGIYSTYLEAVSTFNLYILIPMGLGLFFGSIVFLKLIRYCLNKFFAPTYYCIFGFVLGSILFLYPGLCMNLTGFICIACFFICFQVASLFG